MSCLPGIATRRIAAGTALLVNLACRPTGMTARAPGSALPAAWSTPACLVEDRSTTTADTILVIGAGASVGATPPETLDCDGFRWPARGAPDVQLDDAPAGTDGRDVLELGLPSRDGRRPDVFVTRDPALIAFARQRSEFITTPLPWRRTYVMMVARAHAYTRVPSAAERDALARDVVSVEARGAMEPFAWLSDSSCAIAPRSIASTAPLIAYVRDDPVSRALAERVVSLAAAEPRRDWLALGPESRNAGALRAIPMARSSIPAALAEGRVRAAVLPIERDPRARCGFRDVGRLHAGAVPLVDTREHVIVRRGSGAAFIVTPGGSLHFFRRDAR